MGMTFCRRAPTAGGAAPQDVSFDEGSLGKPLKKYRYANATSGTWVSASWTASSGYS